MAERLIVLSDMWGVKKGLWITSYLGYLQQHYDITFYDCQQLANIDVAVNSEENIHREFVEGGIDTAVAHLLSKEKEPCHYLAFSTGGTIAWKAGLKGLPMKSLNAVSPTRVRYETDKPDCEIKLLYGVNDAYKPSREWCKQMNSWIEFVPNFGHELYSDEKIIQKVSKDLLQKVMHKQFQG
ncbi:hypothetical protein GGR42_001345 [Saonia flava]|uniref:Alpha/beta hydrolase n=1 Tax=Saonia flava TaxID=523696 RepID=A0A846QXB4_9FLAO|nr:hypothetical protein [Saonia flava]NJB70883.1 hypothetical protein [Saonia flava]